MWEGVRQLESIGLKVKCITADGASPNRKFFCMHRGPDSDTSPTYKVRNPFAKEVYGCILCLTPSLNKNSEKLLVTFWLDWHKAYDCKLTSARIL